MKRSAQPSLRQIAKQIHDLARADRLYFTRHALDEMQTDDFTISDVKFVLQGCHVVEFQGGTKYRAEGRTVDAVGTAVIVSIEEVIEDDNGERVVVITVWKLRKV